MSTVGPNSPSAASGWTSSSNVYTSNDVWTTNLVAASSDGNGLLAEGYGFSIPTTTTSIDGVTVVIERHASTSSTIKDVTISLINKSLVTVGDNKADTSVYWPTTDANKTYGSSTDNWNASLTYQDINHANFGVYVKVHNYDGSNSRTAYVDYISVTVDYTDASGQPMQARSRVVPYVRKSQIGW